MARQSRAQDDFFEHEKLRLGGNSIRLFTLRPGNDDSPIVGDITQYAVHRRPEYIALSYSWGVDDEKWPIILNGKQFLVRRNLFDCLARLRQHLHNPFTLWIDALCIDQTDVQERNHIVQLMDQVYERAQTVFVWLGEGDEDSDRAMQFLAQIDVSSQPEQNAVDWFIDTYMSPVDYHQHWLAVVRLFMRPYWSRLWVIQETLLASSIEVFCGQHGLKWEQIEEVVMLGIRAVEWYARSRPDRAEIHTAIVNTMAVRMVARRCNSVRFRGGRESYPALQLLLESFKDAQCFDARDEIFGLLSIAGDYHDKRIDYIDYSLRRTQVFIKFVKDYVDRPLRPASPNLRIPSVHRNDGGEPLWDIRRLKDALRLDIDQILRRRRQDFKSRLHFNDLAENPHESVLTLPCQILYRFVNSGDTVGEAGPFCILRSTLGMLSSNNSWSTTSSEPASPSITIYEPPEAQTKLKEVAEEQGYKICNASLESSRLSTPVLESPHPNVSFKFFHRADNDDDDPYVPHLSGIVCPAARSGDYLIKAEDSDLTFVARLHDDGVYEVIGNAIMHEVMSSRLKIKSSAHKLWHHRYLHPLHHHHRHHHQHNPQLHDHHDHQDRDGHQGHHNRHGHDHDRDHDHHTHPLHHASRRRTQTSDSVTGSEPIKVQFSPLMLLMIVSEPTWRQDWTSRDIRGHVDREAVSYAPLQPQGTDDPVMKNFGTKIFTASTHLNRLANQIRDRTTVALEELREMRHGFRET